MTQSDKEFAKNFSLSVIGIVAAFIGLLSLIYTVERYAEVDPYKYTAVDRYLSSSEATPALKGRIKAALLDGKLSNWEYTEISVMADPPDAGKWKVLDKVLKDKEEKK